jgi:hypothetical protein
MRICLESVELIVAIASCEKLFKSLRTIGLAEVERIEGNQNQSEHFLSRGRKT